MTQPSAFANTEFDETTSLENLLTTEDDAENGYFVEVFLICRSIFKPTGRKVKQNILHFVQNLKRMFHFSQTI